CLAPEAVVELLGRRHGEAGRTLVVERAARRVLLALPLERHARIDHFDDVGAGQQVVDEGIRDACHLSAPVPRMRRSRSGPKWGCVRRRRPMAARPASTRARPARGMCARRPGGPASMALRPTVAWLEWMQARPWAG